MRWSSATPCADSVLPVDALADALAVGESWKKEVPT
jgi:hypothetical protein